MIKHISNNLWDEIRPLFNEVGTYYKNKLDELDLNLDLRVRVGENLPWYAAILGGLPAVAGSAVINEIFEEDINNLKEAGFP